MDWPVYADRTDLSRTLSVEEAQVKAPGWSRFIGLTFESVASSSHVLFEADGSALLARGLAADGGRTTIPNILRASTSLEGYQRLDIDLPFWGWATGSSTPIPSECNEEADRGRSTLAKGWVGLTSLC
jgi:hypothetical protein